MHGRTPIEISAATLAEWVGGEILGDDQRVVTDGASLDDATATDLVFVAGPDGLPTFAASPARVALVGRDLDAIPCNGDSKTFVMVDDPKVAFGVVLSRLRPARPRPEIGVSPAAFVHPSATIGAGTNVHPTAHVQEDAVIGENCEILPGAFIGAGCRLGDGVTIHPYAVLYPDVEVGDRVIVHATTVIGSDGFGYRVENGRHVKVPHHGNVRIEDDVEIGASTAIDRGMIGPTVVGEGTKLDNLVQIAHNCRLGKHNIMVGQVGLAGSVTTGDYVVCAGQVGVADHAHLGTGCVLGSKAGVKSDVPAGETWLGQPAQPVQDAIKGMVSARKVPEMRRQLTAIEKRLTALEAAASPRADAEAA